MSGDAEFVAFGVVHDDVAQVVAVPLLADHHGPGRDQFGNLLPDEPGSLGHVPGTWAGHPDVDVHAVLGRLAFGHLEEADGRTPAVGVDDRRIAGFVEAGFFDVASPSAQKWAVRWGSPCSPPRGP